MIRFSCRCGHKIEVDDDQAGGDVQCAGCGLLNTVPTLSDISGLDSDGGYKIDDDAPTGSPSEERLRTLHRAFTRNTTAGDGTEIDLRATVDDLVLAGDIPLADEVPNARPRYDPVTGELIRPLELKPHTTPPADEIPMAKAAITYAASTPRATSLVGAAALLTSPGNLAVLGVMFLLHLFMQGVMIVATMFIFVAIFGIFFVFGVIGHLANVIDEIGPRDMDELPRPFRDLQIGEDMWHPFVHVVTAFGVCLAPALYVLFKVPLPPKALLPAMAILIGIGMIAWPAVLITTSTSGTVLNLRPDRVLGVARAGWASYIGLVVLGIVSFVTYLVGYFASMIGIFKINEPWWMKSYFAYPLLCLGIYLMHLFAWQCGLYYREYHHAFDWLYQRHTKQTAHEQQTVQAARKALRKQERIERQTYRQSTGRMGKW